MEAKIKKADSFDTVKTFREIKESIAKDVSNMDFKEFKKYLTKNKLKPTK